MTARRRRSRRRGVLPGLGPHRTGRGGAASPIVGPLPEGPPFFPDDVVTDTPEALWVAELVREQLLAKTRDELPHAITCRVTEWEWPHIRSRDHRRARLAEGHRDRQGRRGAQGGGHAVRQALPEGAYLDLHVKVERHWQNRDEMLDRFGY